MEKLLILAGPTASGKSALALEIATRIGGEIICCDSMQIYRECDLVTAKPTNEERTLIPHHLLDICNPDERFSAPNWARLAAKSIEEIGNRNKVPIVCGGTGFYLRALLEPDVLAAPEPDENVRLELEARLENEGRQNLYDQLHRVEPEIAEKLGEGDDYRLIRALQIAIQRARGDELPERPKLELEPAVYCLDWPRAELYERIETRVDWMLENGAIEETKRLHERWGANAPALGGVGYKQLVPALNQLELLPHAIQIWKQSTRNYAKRQITWFKHQNNAIWLDAKQDLKKLADDVLKTI
jgi:tRNA dimethylallyltransferase